MNRILIVGQAPSRNTEGLPPFSGRSGERLAALAGVPFEQLGEAFDVANLLDGWPGKQGKGDAFPAGPAREAAARLDLSRWPKVLFAGHRVAAAFGVTKAPYLRWTNACGTRIALLPHPSGVNHWWNDPANVRRARRFLRRCAPSRSLV